MNVVLICSALKKKWVRITKIFAAKISFFTGNLNFSKKVIIGKSHHYIIVTEQVFLQIHRMAQKSFPFCISSPAYFHHTTKFQHISLESNLDAIFLWMILWTFIPWGLGNQCESSHAVFYKFYCQAVSPTSRPNVLFNKIRHNIRKSEI